MSQYVIKVHSRCDLACDHCYMYEHADQSWRGRPHAMSLETLRVAAGRIAEHAIAHRLREVHVVLHGGEPLLLGRPAIRSMLAQLRATVGTVARLDLRMQSNGVLLTEDMCALLVEYGVRVGISLDGDREANDRHRRYGHGAGSHAQVLRALSLLRRPAYRSSYAGILCTVDLRNDPIRVYEALLAEQPPHIDLLLPHATWDRPPPRGPGAAPYAAWLTTIYDRWAADGRPVPIRLFDSLESTAAGGPSGTEALGVDPADLVVIETDGAWEQADSLKTAYDGAPATGLNVFANRVDEVVAHPGIAARQGGLDALCGTCRTCPVVRRCGGGLFAHRYRTGHGFDNPSVYCADLKALVTIIGGRPSSEPLPVTESAPRRDPVLDRILDQIGSGYGDAQTMELLASAQQALVRALLVKLATGADADGETGKARLFTQAWALLARLDSEHPAAVRAVLTHPYVRPWLVTCLDPTTRRPADPAYLGCLAAAAAVRAGVSVDVEVPIRDGAVFLPGLGRFGIEPHVGDTAVVSVSSRGFTVDGGRTRSGVWQPVRRLDLPGLTLALDDTDPYRDCHEWPVASRLPPVLAGAWERSIVDAWRRIGREVPGHIPAFQAALRVLVPLVADPAGGQRSSAARHAFGGVGVALPAGDDQLAILLLHEVQHIKLGAVLDICTLVDPTSRVRLEVPWRPDPRPVELVLQGIYAHLGIADAWRARRDIPGDDRHVAGAHYRRYRDWVRGAAEALAGTGALTSYGRMFVDRIRKVVNDWPDADV